MFCTSFFDELRSSVNNQKNPCNFLKSFFETLLSDHTLLSEKSLIFFLFLEYFIIPSKRLGLGL